MDKTVRQICLVVLWIGLGNTLKCSEQSLARCVCGSEIFEGKTQFIVNCTDTGFNDTNSLQHLPSDIEILIFNGNNIPELPWNVFGTLQNYEKLHVVDMSNNKIREVQGKSYHHVSNVRRLILNHNRISISDDLHHPRIFSNFVNLEELHLTNAFEDNSDNLGIDLHDIFVSSNLTKLLKLHLEQNEIVRFKDRKVFCDLPKLLDIHLGDNRLTGIDFDIGCLRNLRFIDLEGNNITKLTAENMEVLDSLPARNQSLKVDLTDNPFLCECGVQPFFLWLQSTKVTVSNIFQLRCHRDRSVSSETLCKDEMKLVTFVEAPHPATTFLLVFLSLAVVVLLIYFVYNNKSLIRQKLNPMVETVSRKVYYSSIQNTDDQEIEV